MNYYERIIRICVKLLKIFFLFSFLKILSSVSPCVLNKAKVLVDFGDLIQMKDTAVYIGLDKIFMIPLFLFFFDNFFCFVLLLCCLDQLTLFSFCKSCPLVICKTRFTQNNLHFNTVNFNCIGNLKRSTIINTSRQMMSYSDFPIPQDWPTFMHNQLVCRYLEDYAHHFNVTSKYSLTKRPNTNINAINIDTINWLHERKILKG